MLTAVIFGPLSKRYKSVISQAVAKGCFVKARLLTTVHRRDLLRVAVTGAAAAAVSTVVPEPAAAEPVDLKDKRKARYQANSAEVQDFYRVNSYPAR
ncbi:MAG: formate dehydrogenase [Bradyrhizobium sp.]|nr:formate dehydrogenase [Bradyrhizobium sp.]